MSTFRDVMIAYKATRQYVHETPILRSNALRQETGHEEIVLKCENLQRTGSYNFRGVLNYVIRSKQRDLGVNHFVTQGSADHGLGVALAANSFAATGHIVVPEATPDRTVKAIEHYGGNVYRCGADEEEQMRFVQKLLDKHNKSSKNAGDNTCVYVHPQDEWLLSGNGTVGVELMLQTDSSLDAIVVPAACGTLAAGVALAVKEMKPNIAVFAVECALPNSNDAAECSTTTATNKVSSTRVVENGDRDKRHNFRDLASQFNTQLNEKLAQCINQHVDDVLKVSETQIRYAFRYIYERCKLVIDLNGAMAVGAVLSRHKILEPYRRVGIVLAGGNVELDEIPRLARL